MSYNIYHNLLIKASTEEVFDVVPQPEQWTLKSSGKPGIDSEYNLNFTDQYNWFCKVSKVKNGESFYLKMTNPDKDWNLTTFGFDLEVKENGTYLKFSHLNWRKNKDHFKHSSFYWTLLLNGLKNYLEKGVVVSFEERS